MNTKLKIAFASISMAGSLIIDSPVYEGAPAGRARVATEYSSDDYVATITTEFSGL